MLNKISAKNKTMLFVTVLLLAFSAILLWTIFIGQKNKLKELERGYYDNISLSYRKILEKHNDFYTNRAKANINSPGIKEAVIAKNRDLLYELSLGRWKALSNENTYLKIMHFHNPDGTSLMRMHKPMLYGDNLKKIRPMAEEIHREKKPLYGFEPGLYFLAYRTILPIFDKDKKYIGALEFGSRADLFLNELKYYNNLKGAVFVKDNNLNLYKENNDFSISGYTMQYINTEKGDLLRHLKDLGYDFQHFYHVHFKGKAYNIYSFDMTNFQGSPVAKTVLIHDMSKMEKDFIESMKKLIIFLAALLVFLLTIINMGFKKIISALDRTNSELNSNKKFLQLILDNTAHAVIATKPDGTLTLFNKKAEAMLGYSESEMVGKTTPIKFHKSSEILEKSKELSNKLGRKIEPNFDTIINQSVDGPHDSCEWTYVSKDGYEFPVSLYITTMEDEYGKVSGYVGIAEDVSLKKILETKLRKQKDELEAVFNTSLDGIAIMDLETNFIFFNPAYLKLTGYTAEELLQKSCLDLTHPNDRKMSKEGVEKIFENGYLENFEKRCIRKDGKVLTVNMSFVLMADRKRFLATTKDITGAKEKEKQINEYIELVDKHTIASRADMQGNYTYISEGFSQISEYSKDELEGKNHRVLRHPDVTDEYIQSVFDTVAKGDVWKGEVSNLTKSGKEYYTYAFISGIMNEKGELIGYTSISHDITDKKRIEKISVTDGLTGIFNRRHFNDIFPKYINSAKRQSDLMNFIILDIDHFKQYNDNYGHQQGDEALKTVASALKASVQRADDICFRLGGEEFGILYKTKTVEDAIKIAERIRQEIENLGIEHEYSPASDVITISIGLICSLAEDIESTDALYAEADKLLYKAKANGRNRIEYSTPD